MFNDKAVSVVLMTYAERDSIRAVIEGFFATGVVDEVVVVDNNAAGRHRGAGRGHAGPPRPRAARRATATPPGAGWRRRAAT